MIPRPALRRLSPREHDIALLVAQGHPSKTIAAMLGISVWTVLTHLRRIYARYGVQSRAAMIATLLTGGLLETYSSGPGVTQVSDSMKSWMPSARSSGTSRKRQT